MNKEHILEEIKRTSENNGGVPLGVSRFFSETGIKEADWRGKYWIRWSDALKEAGYSPNQMQKAYDDNVLIDYLIELIRELGHFPLVSELKLKSRSDPDFPSHNVFRRFGGNKAGIIEKILKFVKDSSEHDDIKEICLTELGNSCGKQSDDVDGGSNDELNFGFVYLMKSGNYYKIGKSNSVGRREYEIGLQLPERLTLVHSISTDDPGGIENYWHRRFADKRKNGEWFSLSSADISAFKRRKFM